LWDRRFRQALSPAFFGIEKLKMVPKAAGRTASTPASGTKMPGTRELRARRAKCETATNSETKL
jgi:hypothetical protein